MGQIGLSGKTALITGAGQRIGKVIALALAAEEVNIIIHYRKSLSEISEITRELAECKVRSWQIAADFSQPRSYETLVKKSLKMAGKLDILVNNASEFASDTLENVQFDDVVRSLGVNAWAPFVLSRDFARLAGQGSVVNILDSKITGYDWPHISYSLSKHVLAELTRMCAARFAPYVRVNAVAPGLILPPAGKDERYLNRLAKKVPLKRHGGPHDVAEAVLYLLKNDYVTGQTVFVDGGRHLVG